MVMTEPVAPLCNGLRQCSDVAANILAWHHHHWLSAKHPGSNVHEMATQTAPVGRRASVLSLLLLLPHLCHAVNVCLLRFTVDPAQSPFVLSGNVSRPVAAYMHTATPLMASGHVYMLLPAASQPAAAAAAVQAPATANTSCPVFTPANVDQLLAGSQLVSPQGLPGVLFEPRIIPAAVNTVNNNRTVGQFNLTDIDIAVQSLEPLQLVAQQSAAAGGALAAPMPFTPHALELVVVNGSMKLDSPLVGPHLGSMATVARNLTVLVGVELLPAAANGSQQLQLTLQQLQLFIALSPKNTPGLLLTTANVSADGTAVARAMLNDPSELVLVDDSIIDWNQYPRLQFPVIVPLDSSGQPKGAPPPAQYVLGSEPAGA